MKNNAIKKIHIVLLIVILLVSLPVYRIYLRQIVEVKLSDIQVSNLRHTIDEYYKYELRIGDNQVKDIVNNPSNYKFIVYKFNIENISKRTRISYVSLKPEFSPAIKSILMGYERQDGVVPICIEPLGRINGYDKIVLVKAEGYTNKELIEMAKKDKFTITGITGNSFFDIGYNSKTVKYQQ